MAAPFQASKLFESNNGSTGDGWDDWDWVDNTNVKSTQNLQQQQQQQHHHHQHQQLPPPPAVFANNPMIPTSMHVPNYNNNNYHVTQPMTETSALNAPVAVAAIAANADNSIPANNNGFFVPTSSHINNNVGLGANQQSEWTAPASLPPQPSQQHHHQQQQSFFNNNNNNNVAANSMPYMQVETSDVAPPIPVRGTPFRDSYRADSVEQMPPAGENGQTELPPAQLMPMAANLSNTLPPVMAPPSLDQMPFANTNPFKRVGTHTHRTPSPAAPQPTTTHTASVNQTQIFSSQAQPINPVQHATPLQSAVNRSPATYSPQTPMHAAAVNYSNAPFHGQLAGQAAEPVAVDATAPSKSFPHQPDNLELAPHNDRNEYLQTGHLSEEGNNAGGSEHHQTSLDANNDHLPPPGLSRLVLGEPKASQAAVQSQDAINHPMPVLDRLIPGGTDLTYSTNLNLERQADGQDTDESSAPPTWSGPSVSTHPPPENQVYVPTGSESGNDRNLYLVAGESTDANIQRVVTGVENVENQEVPIVEQQRELEMDGENVDDNFQPNRVNIPSSAVREREEPIEGANTMDEIVVTPPSTANATGNLAATQSDSVEDLDSGTNYNQKYNSNPSTGNDESDKEKSYYNRKGANSRRSEERSKRRGADEKHDKRYETEDTDFSVRGNRRRNRDAARDKYEKSNDGGYDSNKERGDYRVGRGGGGGGNEKSDRSYRDRPSGRDKHHRDSSRDDEDRYDSRYRDRGGRYDTDASRYGPDDPRYDRNGRRRNDRDRDYGRYRDDRPDRQYRKERERGNRDGRPHPGRCHRILSSHPIDNNEFRNFQMIATATIDIPSMKRTSTAASREADSQRLPANVIETGNVIAAMAANAVITIRRAVGPVAVATIIRHSIRRSVRTIHIRRTINSSSTTRTCGAPIRTRTPNGTIAILGTKCKWRRPMWNGVENLAASRCIRDAARPRTMNGKCFFCQFCFFVYVFACFAASLPRLTRSQSAHPKTEIKSSTNCIILSASL